MKQMEHFIQIERFLSCIFVLIEQLFRLLVALNALCELSWLVTSKYLTKKQIIWLYVVKGPQMAYAVAQCLFLQSLKINP